MPSVSLHWCKYNKYTTTAWCNWGYEITTQYVLEKSLAENVKFIDAFHLIELLHHTVIIYVNVLYKLSATELDTGRTLVAIIITCDHYYTSG